MVKIVVRTAEEIIGAYLKSMGFDEKYDLSALLTGYPNLKDENNSGHSVVEMLDLIVAEAAVKVFAQKAEQSRLIALYKIAYLELQGAKKWGISPLLPNFQDVHYQAQMQGKFLCSAPEYCFSEMPVQLFETFKPSVVQKLLRNKNNA